jgi:hypothetical protein
MRQFITGIAFLMIITGCTKDFHLDPKAVKSLYVIEGRISTMSGPYYVRVTKSIGLLPTTYASNARDSAEPVKNALLIITDDNGITDTLIPARDTVERWMHQYDDAGNVVDSQYLTRKEIVTIHDRGYYQTTKIKGLPGNTYRLRVEIGDEIFQASAYMPPVTPLVDAAIRDTLVIPYDTSFPTPIAYFRDPPGEKNYYMLKVQHPGETMYDNYFYTHGHVMNNSHFDYSIFDDKLLVPEVNAIPFYYTFLEENRSVILYMWRTGGPYQMRLGSLTKEAYNYFNVLAKQMTYDGNIYKPTPTSPPGNISGGALGLFFASHISDKQTIRR